MKEFPDRLDAETQFPGMPDELQPLHVLGFIEPMATFGAGGGGDEADFLVIADRLHLGRCNLREFSDGERDHVFFPLNL